MSNVDKIVILVDLDKTLAYYTTWGNGEIGEPVPAMVERVKDWLALGHEVRIFTARVAALFPRKGHDLDYRFSADQGDALRQLQKVHEWLLKYLGHEFEVTAVKDQDVTEIWDDRAVRVEANTGVSEIHAAHLYLSAANVEQGSLPARTKALVEAYAQLHARHVELQRQYAEAVGLVWGRR